MQMHSRRCFRRTMGWVALVLLVSLGGSDVAWAANPQDWDMGLPPAANELALSVNTLFSRWLVPMNYVISGFVGGLILYVVWRFRESRNPEPSRRSHFLALEVIWTIVPAVIVVVIMIPSVRSIRASADLSGSEMTVKAIGNQWFWQYEYPDHGGFLYDSYMIDEDSPDSQKPENYRRLMSVDAPMVIPAGTKIRLQVTSNDVLHNFSVSEFAVRIDATPGYLREVPIYPVTQTGTYYGFCSELCGERHSYMPIEVQVVSKEEFADWVKDAAQRYASASPVSGAFRESAR